MAGIYFIICILLIVVIILLYSRVTQKSISNYKALPGPRKYPFIGNLNVFLGSPNDVLLRLKEIFKKYEHMTALWVGPKLTIAVYNAEYIETILHDENSTLIKSVEYSFMKPWLGEGLISTRVPDPQYKRHKKIIRPFFSMASLLSTLPIFNKNARLFTEDLKKHLDKGEFDIYPSISLFTIYNILETSLGMKYENMNEEMLAYVRNIERLGDIIHHRHFKFWYRIEWIFNLSSLKKQQDECLKFVNPATLEVISERKRLLQNGKLKQDNGRLNCFVDNMLLAEDDSGNRLTIEEIKDEVMTAMFAGQDTTTSTLGFVLSVLGIYHKVQDTLIKEIDEVLEGYDDAFEITQETLKKFVYLEQVIKETWRLYPPVPAIGRTANKDIKLDQYVIPKGSTIALLIMHLHRQAASYPDPEKFNPEHFSAENVKNRNPYAFMPFSAGTRACLGRHYATMFVKIALIHIFRKFRVTSIRPRTSFVLSAQLTLKRKDGYMISLHKR